MVRFDYFRSGAITDYIWVRSQCLKQNPGEPAPDPSKRKRGIQTRRSSSRKMKRKCLLKRLRRSATRSTQIQMATRKKAKRKAKKYQ